MTFLISGVGVGEGIATAPISTGSGVEVTNGIGIFFTTLAFNLVGDGLRDALDPRTGG